GGRVAGDSGIGRPSGVAVRFGTRQYLLFGGEPFLLCVVDQTGSIDLAQLEPEEVELTGPGAGIAPESSEGLVDRRHCPAGGNERADVDGPEAVERLALGWSCEQRLMRVLAVQVDQPGADVSQL